MAQAPYPTEQAIHILLDGLQEQKFLFLVGVVGLGLCLLLVGIAVTRLRERVDALETRLAARTKGEA